MEVSRGSKSDLVDRTRGETLRLWKVMGTKQAANGLPRPHRMGRALDLVRCGILWKEAGVVVAPTRAGAVSKVKYRPTEVFGWENKRCEVNDVGVWCVACGNYVWTIPSIKLWSSAADNGKILNIGVPAGG